MGKTMETIEVKSVDAYKTLGISFEARTKKVPCPKYAWANDYVFDVPKNITLPIGKVFNEIPEGKIESVRKILNSHGIKYIMSIHSSWFMRPKGGFDGCRIKEYAIKIMSGNEPDYEELKAPELQYYAAIAKAKQLRKWLADQAVKVEASSIKTYSDYYFMANVDKLGHFACPQPNSINKDAEWLSMFIKIGQKERLCALQGAKHLAYAGADYATKYSGIIYIPQEFINKAAQQMNEYEKKIFNQMAGRM